MLRWRKSTSNYRNKLHTSLSVSTPLHFLTGVRLIRLVEHKLGNAEEVSCVPFGIWRMQSMRFLHDNDPERTEITIHGLKE